MNRFDDIPLPGLDLTLLPGPKNVITTRRPYSAQIAPTAAAIERFWARVVRGPHCWIWTGAISGGDGYGRKRAKLHLVDYSTSL